MKILAVRIAIDVCLCFFSIEEFSDNVLHISKGLFGGICLIVLVVGIAVGAVLGLMVFRTQRRKSKSSKSAGSGLWGMSTLTRGEKKICPGIWRFCQELGDLENFGGDMNEV